MDALKQTWKDLYKEKHQITYQITYQKVREKELKYFFASEDQIKTNKICSRY